MCSRWISRRGRERWEKRTRKEPGPFDGKEEIRVIWLAEID